MPAGGGQQRKATELGLGWTLVPVAGVIAGIDFSYSYNLPGKRGKQAKCKESGCRKDSLRLSKA